MNALEVVLAVLCDVFFAVCVYQILVADPYTPQKLKFKLKSKKGLVHFGRGIGYLVPGLLISIAPLLFTPKTFLDISWQSSSAAWFVLVLRVATRNFEVPYLLHGFSISYFIVTAVLYILADETWLVLASGASAVPASIAVVGFASQGVQVARERKRRGGASHDASEDNGEDELLLGGSVDEFDDRSGRDSVLPPDGKKAPAIYLLMFSYMNKLIRIGSERQINREDLPDLAPHMAADNVGRRTFGSAWKAEAANPKPSLSAVLVKVFGRELILAGTIKIANDLCNFAQPLIMQRIILFLQEYREDSVEVWEGIWLAIGLIMSYFVQSGSFNQYFHSVNIVSTRTRSALMWTVFDKSCKLSAEGRGQFSSGAVQNLMANDARRLSDLVMFLNYLWSGIFQICVAFVLLVQLLGVVPTMAGILICLINSPLQGQLMSRIRRTRELALSSTDERVKTLSEIFQGIKVIKFYAWEDSFVARVLKLRNVELSWIRKALFYSAGASTIVSTLPVILSTVSIGAYALMGNPLDPAVVFPAIALLNVLRAPLLFLPNVLVSLAQAKASINRLEDFLGADEVSPPPRKKALKHQKYFDEGADIYASGATFSWDRSLSSHQTVGPILSGVSLTIPRGDLCVVVGQTGSGKSTLLCGLLNEAFLMSGYCAIRPGAKVAFVDQTAFIFNASLKDNILFGEEYDEAKYKRALSVTALEKDLALLPAGDETEIGSRGVNLSGGQRQRVSLARAVYSDADIYLLDDPLSAVDASVGAHIFKECIAGDLRDKTRVFVTNQLHYLNSPHVNQICFLKNGEVAEHGTYDELMAKDATVASLIRSHVASDAPEETASTSSEKTEAKGETKPEETASVVTKSGDGHLTGVEKRETGRVRMRDYGLYVSAFGGPLVGFVLVCLMALAQACNIGSTYWLSVWSSQGIQPDPGSGFYLSGYALLGAFSVVVAGLASISLAFAGISASRTMHHKMLLHVLGAPMAWFDATPTGRLINRFNADIDKIDSTLMQAIQGLLRQFLNLVGILVVIITGVPLFILPMLASGYFYYVAQDYYRKSSVDLRRLEAIVRSPLYNHFTETLDGLVTLRAYGQIWRAQKLNQEMVDLNALVSFGNLCANRWLSTRLELMSIGLVFCVTLLSVLGGKRLDPAFAGLMLSYALQLTTSLTWVIRTFTDMESQMSAVERIGEYSSSTGVPQEEPPETKARLQSVKKSWPRYGQIDFSNITMRYRADLPPVLSDISFTVQRGEKIGICGRTGAGKSSLVNVLFRLTPLDEGSVVIDDVDTNNVALQDVRGSLNILPQEPLIFSGTFRNNLDPFEERGDEELWRALRIVGLDDLVAAVGSGLDAPVSEGGSNLSVGQRQLLCLGRSLLRDTSILVLDEATSGVDIETDQRVQETLAKEFKDVTTLTIAHRINTIITYDKILLLDAGRIKEFDTPSALLSDPNSIFSSLIDELGPTMAGKMRSIARGSQADLMQVQASAEASVQGQVPQRAPGDEMSRKEVVRRAYVDMRNAIVNNESVDWIEELHKTKTGKEEWKSQLRGMVEKLDMLSRSYLMPVDLEHSEDRVFRMARVNTGEDKTLAEAASTSLRTRHAKVYDGQDYEEAGNLKHTVSTVARSPYSLTEERKLLPDAADDEIDIVLDDVPLISAVDDKGKDGS
uniref:Probable ATP-dependent transporter ycf16 n=2 Tax=Rhodosorus marinus TaxID=101924 RepID=A0A7S3A6C5_9RHOD|mmetsp:Transcript_4433/g.18906  ORF Transcript_4433/g.18906 Transcript_4433/m.18906 type:complete len:1658 (+) Transcript_4433:216-5189(+)